MSWKVQMKNLPQLVLRCGPEVKQDVFANEKVILDLFSNKIVIDNLQSLLNNYEHERTQILSKSFEKAEISRSEGNRLYIKGNNEKAIFCYNDSIRNYTDYVSVGDSCSDFISKNRQGLSISYANRSAAFFNKNDFNNCLADIDMAIKLPYPYNLRHKLFKRKLECHLKLCRLTAAKRALEEAKLAIEGLPEDQKEKESRVLNSLKEKIIAKEKSDYPNHQSSNDISKVRNNKDLRYGVGELLNASAGIELQYNNTAGRHFIATKSFNLGDLVISERAFVSVLLPEFYSKHCNHCLSKVEAIIPCFNCNLVSYCSVACQEKSWQSYHNIECKYLPLLNEIGISHLAMRIILKTNIYDMFKEYFQQIQHVNNKQFPFGIHNKYFNGYKAIYSLVSHTQETSKENNSKYGLSALVLLFVLKREKYFEKPEFEDLEEKINENYSKCKLISKSFQNVKEMGFDLSAVQLWVASLLYYHINQVACNSIAITGLSEIESNSASAVIEYEQKRIGTAIYTTSSLLNHSCDATCILTFNRDILDLKIAKDVNPGDEITICYGPHYKKMNVRERINCLKNQYYFQCSCQPCKNGLGINNICMDYRCFNCESAIQSIHDGKCISCSEAFDPEFYKSLYNSSLVHLKEANNPSIAEKPEMVLKHLNKCLELQNKIFYQYHPKIASLHNAIASCLAKQHEYSSSKIHFEKSLAITTHIYGENSTEVGYGLLTLSDLMIKIIHCDVTSSIKTASKPNFQQIEKCSHMVRKAIKILRNLCVEGSEELIDLNEKDKYLCTLLSHKEGP